MNHENTLTPSLLLDEETQVTAIKKAIKEGRYTINDQVVAEKLIKFESELPFEND